VAVGGGKEDHDESTVSALSGTFKPFRWMCAADRSRHMLRSRKMEAAVDLARPASFGWFQNAYSSSMRAASAATNPDTSNSVLLIWRTEKELGEFNAEQKEEQREQLPGAVAPCNRQPSSILKKDPSFLRLSLLPFHLSHAANVEKEKEERKRCLFV
jgi:hypothetical protein